MDELMQVDVQEMAKELAFQSAAQSLQIQQLVAEVERLRNKYESEEKPNGLS